MQSTTTHFRQKKCPRCGNNHDNDGVLCSFCVDAEELKRKKAFVTPGNCWVRCLIEREGDTLRHCVGDYAQRHVAGKLTICFIRRTETPDASLYTVEMQDNRLIQIHGYKNDVNLPWDKKPEAVMAWLLEKPLTRWCGHTSPPDWPWTHGAGRRSARHRSHRRPP